VKLGSWWVSVILVIGGLQAVACRPAPATTASKSEAPARVESIANSDLKRVVVTEKAAERLGIMTTPVVEKHIGRTRVVGAEIATLESGATVVRVRATPNDLNKVDRAQPARVQPLLPRDATTTANMASGRSLRSLRRLSRQLRW
jgi:hypothetical protein